MEWADLGKSNDGLGIEGMGLGLGLWFGLGLGFGSRLNSSYIAFKFYTDFTAI